MKKPIRFEDYVSYMCPSGEVMLTYNECIQDQERK